MTPYAKRRSLKNYWLKHLENWKIVSGSVVKQVYGLLSKSWVNGLLLCVPAGIALHAVSGPVVAVLIVNFLAAVGLHGIGDAILRSITSRIGRRYGMLLYISASNLMQAISSVVLLLRGEIVMMQMTLIGNLLVNLLLLPALSIFYATYHRKSMVHEYAVTKKYTLLLFLAAAGFVVPTMFDLQTALPMASTAGLSRGASILLIFTYGAYLFFQLSTHRKVFERDPRFEHYNIHSNEAEECVAGALEGIPTPQRQRSETQELSIGTASVMFIATTTLVYFSVDFFVDSVLELGMVPDYFGFSGYILIPILNSDVAAFEQVEQSMDMVLSFTLDKSLQLSLFVSPFLVLVAWGVGYDEAGLSFDVLGVTALLTSVYLVNALSALGNFNWSVN